MTDPKPANAPPQGQPSAAPAGGPGGVPPPSGMAPAAPSAPTGAAGPGAVPPPPGSLVPTTPGAPEGLTPARAPRPPEEATRMVKPDKREKKVRQRRQGTAVLLVERPGIPPAPLALTRPRTIIGRDRDNCDVVLEDEVVSRQHASITKEQSGFYVLHDLGSRNGILVGGAKTEKRTLLDGDVFSVGDTRFTFQYTAAQKKAAPAPAPVALPPPVDDKPKP